MQSASFTAVSRLTTAAGTQQLEGMVVDRPVDEIKADSWDSYRPIDHWTTPAQDPEGRLSREQRVDLLLAEAGWQRADAVARPWDAPFPVTRVRETFRAQVVVRDDGPVVAVLLHTTGDLVTELPAGDAPVVALEQQGWRVLRRLDDWAGQPWLVAPYDWDVVLGRASATLRTERARADTANRQWRLLVQEAVLSGIPGNKVAAATGVSPQRINQVAKRPRS